MFAILELRTNYYLCKNTYFFNIEENIFKEFYFQQKKRGRIQPRFNHHSMAKDSSHQP